tara:strand:+ start:412 stop:624 length:213 start_codon:yes stop_codon:yes gene_type:complete
MIKLPIIRYNNKDYTFDYRLRQLRILTSLGIDFINLSKDENNLLSYVMSLDNKHLINVNMKEILGDINDN